MKKSRQNNDTKLIMRMLEKMYVQRIRDMREIEQALKEIKKIAKERENEQNKDQAEQKMVQSDDRHADHRSFAIARTS